MHLAAPIWPLAQSTMSYLQAYVLGFFLGFT
jgi:hypothetical protein